MRPSDLREKYERLLVENVSTVSSIENSLRNLTWLLPGRFEDAELASEGLYALLNIVSSYHDTLLQGRVDPSLSLPPRPFRTQATPASSSPTAPTAPRTIPLLPPASDHSRYTRYWTHRSGVYRRVSRALVTIGYVELLVEMIAKKKGGDRRRWRLVLSLESIKTVLRLVLLLVTRRPVLQHPAPQREYDPSSLPQEAFTPSGPMHPKSASSSNTTMPAVRHVPSAPLRNHLYPMMTSLPESHLPSPQTLLPEISTPSAFASEVLGATSTLVHILLLLRFAKRQQSSPYRPYSLPTLSRNLTPFVIPLLLRLLARRLRQDPLDSDLLAEHYAQQDKRLLSSFFLTGPLWVGWTRPKIMGIVKGLERIPIVGLVGEFVEGYLPLVDDYFYYTSS